MDIESQATQSLEAGSEQQIGSDSQPSAIQPAPEQQPQTAEQPVEAKRKRGRPRQQKLEANEIVESGGGLAEKQAKTRVRRTGNKFKLTLFDEDALKLVRRGIASAAEVSRQLGIGEGEVEKRFQELKQAGFVSEIQENPGKYGLTVKAYNQFIPDSLETTLEQKARKRVEREQKRKEKQLKKKLERVEEKREAGNTIIEIPGQAEHEKVDLQELLARGAPKAPSFFAKRMQEKAVRQKKQQEKPSAPITPTQSTQSPSSTQPSSEKNSVEKCVLCKADFVLAVSGGNPKYGHCFCGAAYHKDCYDGVLQTVGECVQCGKTLDIILDKESLEEVKKIKGVFE